MQSDILKSMAGEQVLYDIQGGFQITTHRIRLLVAGGGERQLGSIMLEELTSCQFHFTSHPNLLVIAGIVFAVSLLMHRMWEGAVPAGIIVALIFVIAYAVTRQRVISFRSPDYALHLKLAAVTDEQAINIINIAEAAKNARYMLLAR